MCVWDCLCIFACVCVIVCVSLHVCVGLLFIFACVCGIIVCVSLHVCVDCCLCVYLCMCSCDCWCKIFWTPTMCGRSVPYKSPLVLCQPTCALTWSNPGVITVGQLLHNRCHEQSGFFLCHIKSVWSQGNQETPSHCKSEDGVNTCQAAWHTNTPG